MFKKYMCLVLCLLLALSTVSTTAFAASPAVDELTASAVTFKDAGGALIVDLPETQGTVSANINVGNASTTTSKDVYLWIGKYEDDVLVDMVYQKASIAPNTANTPVPVSVSMPNVKKETATKTVDGVEVTYDKVVLKAYIWTGFFGGKALAKPAAIPSIDDSVFITKNGEIWEGFNSGVLTYNLLLPRTETPAPVFRMIANDNKVDISNSDVFALNTENVINVTDKNGAVTKYSFTYAYEAPTIYNLTVGPQTDRAKYAGVSIKHNYYGKLAGGVSLQTDREGWKAAYVGSNVKGLDLINVAYNPGGDAETALTALKRSTGTYVSFMASGACTMYVFSVNELPHYAGEGWTLVSSGLEPNAPDGYADLDDFFTVQSNYTVPAPAEFPYMLYCAVVQSGSYVSYRAHKYVYKKSFNAWDIVNVPAQNDNTVPIIPAISWAAPAPVVENEARIAAISYNAGTTPKTIFDVTPGDAAGTAYNVLLPYGTTTVDAIEAAALQEGATVTVSPEGALTFSNSDRFETATITITAVDGTTTATYTVNFEVDLPISEKVNKIYNVTTKSLKGVYVSTEEFDNGSAYAKASDYNKKLDRVVIQEGIVDGTTIAYSDGDSTKAEWKLNTNGLVTEGLSTIIRRSTIDAYKSMTWADTQTAHNVSWFMDYFDYDDPADATDGPGTNSPWLSFYVSSGAYVYVAAVEDAVAEWPNKPEGWEVVGGANVKVGDKSAKVYRKHFNKGQKVDIPNYGRPSSFSAAAPTTYAEAQANVIEYPSVYFVAWDNATGTPSSDATLASLTVNGVTPDGFDGTSGADYFVTVSQSAPTVTIKATPVNAGATVVYSPSNVIDMSAVSSAMVNITTTSQDGSEEIVNTVTITKSSTALSDATASGIKYYIDGVGPVNVAGFASDNYTYNVDVPIGTASAKIEVDVTDEYGASVEYSTPNGEVTFDPAATSVADRTETVVATITAEDGTTELNYTVNFKIGLEFNITSNKLTISPKDTASAELEFYNSSIAPRYNSDVNQGGATRLTTNRTYSFVSIGENLLDMTLITRGLFATSAPYVEATPGEALYEFVAPEAGTLYALHYAELPTYTDEYGDVWEVVNDGQDAFGPDGETLLNEKVSYTYTADITDGTNVKVASGTVIETDYMNTIPYNFMPTIAADGSKKGAFVAGTAQGTSTGWSQKMAGLDFYTNISNHMNGTLADAPVFIETYSAWQNPNENTFGWCYKLSFEEGDTVEIPCPLASNASISHIPFVFVKWESDGAYSNDATIEGVKVNGTAATLNEGVYEYTSASMEAVEIIPVTTSSWATYTVSPASLIPTVEGTDATITVKAEDGTTTATYNAKIYKTNVISTDATASALKYSVDGAEAVAVDGFDSATYTYTVNVPAGTQTVKLEAIPTVTGVTNVDYDVTDGEVTFDLLDMTPAGRTKSVKATLTAEDGTTVLEYTVTFVREAEFVITSDKLTISPKGTDSATLEFYNDSIAPRYNSDVNQGGAARLTTNRNYSFISIGKNLLDMTLITRGLYGTGGPYIESTPGEALYEFVAPEAGTLYALHNVALPTYTDEYGDVWEVVNDGQDAFGPNGTTLLDEKVSYTYTADITDGSSTVVTSGTVIDTDYKNTIPYDFEPTVAADGSKKGAFVAGTAHGTSTGWGQKMAGCDFYYEISKHQGGTRTDAPVFIETYSAYQNPESVTLKWCYKLDFEAGNVVKIPCPLAYGGGTSLSQIPFIFVKWESDGAFDSDATIEGVKVNGNDATLNAGVYEYTVAGTTAVTITPITTSSWATYTVSPATVVPTASGTTATVTVKAEDGTTETYTVTVYLDDILEPGIEEGGDQ